MWSEQLPNGKVKFIERYTDPMTLKEHRVSVRLSKNTASTRKQAQATLDYKIAQKIAASAASVQKDRLRLISIHAPAKGATAIFHKIINLYCKTSTNTTRINSLNINKKYINRIKARILNYFFGANHLINLCKLYIRTCNL